MKSWQIFIFIRDYRRGDLVFASLFVLSTIFLISQLDKETSWIDKLPFLSQPAFWPLLSLSAMGFFGLLYLAASLCSKREAAELPEVFFWLRSLEYLVWFLAYVWLVPFSGYLPATLLFMTTLTIRAGYRQRNTLIAAVAAGFLIVLVFKTLLRINIPGGRMYEYLPETVSNFMLVYF